MKSRTITNTIGKFFGAIGILIGLSIMLGIFILPISIIYPNWLENTWAGEVTNLALSLIVLFGLGSILITRFLDSSKESVFGKLGMKKGLTWRQVWLIVLLVFCSMPFVSFLVEINNMISFPESMAGVEQWLREFEAENKPDDLMKVSQWWQVLLLVGVVGVVPGVCEEMFFRGMMQGRILKRCNIHVAIWVTALVFATIHFTFFQSLALLIFGVMFGYVYIYTGSLWGAMIMHFTNNALSVLFSCAEYNKLWGAEALSDASFVDMWYIALGSAVVTLALLNMIIKSGGTNKNV